MARYKVGKRSFSLIKDDCRLSNENSFALVTTDTELNAPLTNSMSRTGHDIFIFLCLCRVDYEVALAWRNSSFPHRFHLDLWFDKNIPLLLWIHTTMSASLCLMQRAKHSKLTSLLIAVTHGEFQTKSLSRIIITKAERQTLWCMMGLTLFSIRCWRGNSLLVGCNCNISMLQRF